MRRSRGRGRCSFSVPTTEATHSLHSSEDGVGRGIGPCVPSSLPSVPAPGWTWSPCSARGNGSWAPSGAPEGGATPIWILAPLQGDRGEVHPLVGEPEEGGHR